MMPRSTPADIRPADLLARPDLRAARKLLIAPTVQAGVAIRTGLARTGVPLAGFEVTTPLGLAKRLVEWAEPDGARPYVPVSTVTVEVACLLHDMREGERLVRSARAVARSVAEAREAGLGATAYRRLVSGELGRVASAVHASLERELLESGRRDDALLFSAATATVGSLPDDLVPTVLVVSDDVELSASSVALVEAIAARSEVRCLAGPPEGGVEAPSHTAAERLDWPRMTLDTDGKPAIAGFVEAIGTEAEVRAAVRTMAEHGMCFDEVELAYPGHEPYLAVVRDVLQRTSVPATFAAGIALTDTPPGQAVRSFLRWIGEGMPSRTLLTMLRSGLVLFRRDDERHGLVRALASRLAELRIGTGPGAYRRALASSRDAAVREALDGLLALVPPGDPVHPVDVADAAIAFLRDFAPNAPGEDPESVREEIATRLGELGSARGRAPLRSLVGPFVQVLDGVFLQARAAVPGHVHVVPLSGAGTTGRPHLIILGLDQDAFRLSAPEDGLIPDERRRGPLGSALPRSSALKARPRWWLHRAMGRARAGTTLVRSTVDLESDRALYPSAVWIELRAEAPDAAPVRHALRASSRSDASARPLSVTEALLATRTDPDTVRHVATIAPWMDRGLIATGRATSTAWTHVDGRIELGHDPWTARESVSPSCIEDLAACPFRYFVRYVLGVEAPETRDETVWMDAREKGNLVHGAFRDYVGGWIRAGEPATRSALDRRLEEGLRAFTDEHEPPSFATEHRIRAELRYAADVLMEDVRRAGTEGRVPIAVEREFGRGRRRDGAELRDPYVLRLGAMSIPSHGFVDRVDRLPDGRLAVIDYKTGGAGDYSDMGRSDARIRLQWVLYAYAMEDLSGAEVARSGYLFAGSRELGLGLFEAPPDREETAARLHDMAALPRLGMFPQSAGSTACRWCDYRRVCGDLEIRRREIREKLQETDPDSDVGRAITGWTLRP